MQDTLWNVYSFFVLYANLDGFEPDAAAAVGSSGPGPVRARLAGRDVTVPPPAERSLLDRWILSRLHGLTAEVRASLDAYQVLPATRAIEAFVDDLSNWYVRRGRRRYWRAGSDQDKVAAYQTLYEVLVTMSRLLAPFTPFTTEEIYRNLVRADIEQAAGSAAPAVAMDGRVPESVHHCFYPEPDEALMDESLERRMETIRSYVVLARAARNRAHIRTRQPLKRVILVGPKGDAGGIAGLTDLLTDEVNVKEVRAAANLSGLATHVVKPRFDVLGPRLGPLAPKVARALGRLTPEEAAAAVGRLAAGESITVAVEGQDEPIRLGPGDVEIRTEGLPGWSVEGEDGRYVALDTEISPELLWEGLAREAVNRIQRMRKEAGFDVEDHIETVYEAAGDAGQALKVNREYVASETLSQSFTESPVPEPAGEIAAGGWYVQALDLEGEPVKVAIRQVNRADK
jgi:isoleucyl-tRNA synthetase